MKNTTLLFLVASASCASATTLATSIVNFGGTNNAFNAIQDASGTAIAAGSTAPVFVGTFNESALSTSSSVSDLFNAFTSFAQINPTGSAWISAGFIQGGASADVAPLNNQPVYVFIANTSDIAGTDGNVADASEALIWRLTGQNFVEGGNPTANQPQVVQLLTGNGTVVFGGDTPTGNDPFRLAVPMPIPEPTSSVLLAGSLLALGFRRRRA